MKKNKAIKLWALGLIISMGLVTPALAMDVTLEWDANTESNLAGYKLHWGTQAGSYSSSTDVGNVTVYTLTLGNGAEYYIAATAYDTDNLESDYSNEVWTGDHPSPTPPAAPSMTITIIIRR